MHRLGDSNTGLAAGSAEEFLGERDEMCGVTRFTPTAKPF